MSLEFQISINYITYEVVLESQHLTRSSFITVTFSYYVLFEITRSFSGIHLVRFVTNRLSGNTSTLFCFAKMEVVKLPAPTRLQANYISHFNITVVTIGG